jgi:ABC-type glycerol-3-phosphate transport system substrate-binding protein
MQDFPTNLIGWTQWNPRGSEHAYAEYNYDFYPVPKATKEGDPRFLIITDFAGITPSSEDPRAAYEFLKYITYEAQGYIDRVNVMKNYNKEEFMKKYPNVPEEVFIDDPAFIYSKFGSGMNAIPGSNTDEARNAYRDFHPAGTPDGNPGISYLLDYIESQQLDLYRCTPGYGEAWGYIQDNIMKQIVNGNKAPADIAKELEDAANKILDDWNTAIDEVIGK